MLPKKRKAAGVPVEVQYDDEYDDYDNFQKSDILKAIRLSKQEHHTGTSYSTAGSSTIRTRFYSLSLSTRLTNDEDEDFQQPISSLPPRRTPTTRASTTTIITSVPITQLTDIYEHNSYFVL
ncbi:unnamed protein product [Rhizopus stolonifer]